MANQDPDTAAYDAILEARNLGLDAGQTSSSVAEAALRAAWNNAVEIYGALDEDIQHAACDDGGCNLCILEDFSNAMQRPWFLAEMEKAKREQAAKP
jgi:hypothetical protein